MLEEQYLEQVKEMEPNLVEEIFKRGFKEGNKHITPAPETIIRLEKLENDVMSLTNAFIEHSKLKEQKLDELLEKMKDVQKISNLMGNAGFMMKFFI